MKFQRRNPHLEGVIQFAVLDGFFLLAFLLTLGLSLFGFISAVIPLIVLIFVALFTLMLFATWLAGQNQSARANKFLQSEHCVLYWELTPEEFQPFKELQKAESNNDWKVQLGCLTALIAICGALTGFLVGLDEDLTQGILKALLGLLIGGGIGLALGAVTVLGNKIIEQRAYRRTAPYQAALGIGEVYMDGNYFRQNRERHIRSADFDPDDARLLNIQLHLPMRVRRSSEETWQVIVPERMKEEVLAFLPRLRNWTEPCAD